MRKRGLTIPAVLVVALLVFTAACSNGGGAGGEETATVPIGTGGPTVSVTPTAAPDIRQEDFSTHPVIQGYLDSAGGDIDPSTIIYGDLTGDGVEDAVVPVSSGGEGGPTAIYVFAYGEGGLAALLQVKPQGKSIQAAIENGKLVTTEPVFEANDPLCCPSKLLRKTYGWNGTDMTQTDSETVPATTAGAGG
jgi:hypothetical protein